MSAEPKPASSFNPTWVMVAIAAISHIAMVGGWYRDTADLREFKAAQEKWNAAMERRLSEEQLATGKTLVALQKDVETANRTLNSIQQSLMVRPSQLSQPTP